MPHRYDHSQAQDHWRRVWEEEGVYETPEDPADPTYVLGMFPYTSGALHMGHVRNYSITDAYARYRRMCGDDVLHPMGWDAFGLPAENAAYERDTDPESWTRSCIERMRDELRAMGFGYDWSREVTTCDPDYYQWNQWLFKRFREDGLVEYKAASVNWCPDCETVLADAQVEEPTDDHSHGATPDSACWRCETPVEERELDQWFFTITDYAEELHEGLDDLSGWPEGVREIQRDWIGRQAGAEVTFEVTDHPDIDVFTTRLDTLHGATFVAVAPGHELAAALAEEDEAVAAYRDTVAGASRRSADPAASSTAGVETGVTARHPLTGAAVPVYVAEYVLDDVGTGAVMGVPAHDERDHAFAREHGLPVEQVVEPTDGGETDLPERPYAADGRLAVDAEYGGLTSEAARERLRDHDAVEPAVTYRLRDWLISRQRYWGTPIPVVHCEDCGRVDVPDEDLPVELPEYVQTTGNPLAESEAFVETACPECGQPARRETDTMDTFVDSAWYFLRFLSPGLADAPFDPDLADEWLPVDVYVGGEEHATLHLLYIRFFARALSDIGLLDCREPVEQLRNQGTILHGGEKMSKSKGNAIAPHEYGAETTRLFVLSAAQPEQDLEWTAEDVSAAYDLQQTLYGLVASFVDRDDARYESDVHDRYLEREIDRTTAAVTEAYEEFRYQQVITEIREFARLLGRYRAYDVPYRGTYTRGLRTLAKLVAPVAPSLAEEMWHTLGEDGLVAGSRWPQPLRDAADYRTERDLVETTLADVRDITDVAGIDDPDTVELVVAPEWKHRVYELARDADPETSVVDAVTEDERLQRGEAAAYAADLATERPGLEPVVDGDREVEILRRAAWLLDDEFGAAVTVRRADDGEQLAAEAEPNRPAIQIR
jgi:leucyl-tRNA synthetase